MSEPNLSTLAAKGAAAVGIGQMAVTAIQFAVLLLLARFLAPESFGLFAIAYAIVGFLDIIRNFGLSVAAIQAPTISAAERDNLFWLNVSIGVLLAALMQGLALPIGMVMGESDLPTMLRILSLAFIFNGVYTQYRAEFQRSLRLIAFTAIEIQSTLLAAGVAVLLATRGADAWALVALYVCRSLACAALGVLVGKWFPSTPKRTVSIARFIRFGAGLVGTQTLNFAARNVDSLAIGRSLGTEQLGFYDRAFQMIMLPVGQLQAPATKVALPVLSRLQSEAERWSLYLLHGQRVLLLVVSVAMAIAFAMADPLVPLVLGPGWEPSIPLFRLFAIAGMLDACHFTSSWIFVSKGLSAQQFKFGLVTRPVLVAAVIGAATYRVEAVPIAYIIWLVAVWPFGLWWLARYTLVPWKAILGTGLRIAAVAATVSVVTLGVLRVGSVQDRTLEVALGFTISALGFAIFAVAVPSYRRDWHTLATTVTLTLRSVTNRYAHGRR